MAFNPNHYRRYMVVYTRQPDISEKRGSPDKVDIGEVSYFFEGGPASIRILSPEEVARLLNEGSYAYLHVLNTEQRQEIMKLEGRI